MAVLNRIVHGIVRFNSRRPRRGDFDVQAARRNIESMAAKMPRPRGVRYSETSLDGVPALSIEPEEIRTDGVLLYFHGGGYTSGSPKSHAHLVGFIAKAAGVRAQSVHYRRAPEHRFPAAVEDARAAFRFLVDRGTPPSKICLSGDSAGGGLCLALMLARKEHGEELPAGAALISPWTDMTLSGDSMETRATADPMLSRAFLEAFRSHYANPPDYGHVLASPLFADLSGLPPLLVHVGGHEVLLDDSRRLAERARIAGVQIELLEYPEMMHVWHFVTPLLRESRAAVREIGQFVLSRLTAD